MSRRGEPGAWRLPLMVARAVWQTWRGRPNRRPVLAGLAVAPVMLVLMVLAMPGQTTRSSVEAASPGPGLPPRAAPPMPPGTGPGGPPRPPVASPPMGAARADDFRNRNPFRIRPNRVPDAPPPPPPPPQEVKQPPPPPPVQDLGTKLKLLGTFVMGGSRWAVISVIATAKEDVYIEGDAPLPNSRVIKIEPRQVTLLVDGRQGVIKIDYSDWEGGKQKVVASQPGAPVYQPPPPENMPAPPVQAPADGQPRRLARSEVDGYLDNLNTLLTQVNIQPVFQAGQPAGFRLTDIQKGTILDQIGVSDGDTLRFVNGQRIDSVQSAFQLYNILKESTNVEITVIRNTRPVTLRYLIY